MLRLVEVTLALVEQGLAAVAERSRDGVNR